MNNPFFQSKTHLQRLASHWGGIRMVFRKNIWEVTNNGITIDGDPPGSILVSHPIAGRALISAIMVSKRQHRLARLKDLSQLAAG